METDAKNAAGRPPWNASVEALLETIPGVVTARIEGTRDWVTEVRVWYEPAWPAAQVMAAVDTRLIEEGARLASTQFHAVVAQPDRRGARRARQPEEAPAPVVGGSVADAPLRLVGHRVGQVEPGVVGVHVWIEWDGRIFSGAAVGPAAPPGNLRTAAIATLRALHSCLQVLYVGPHQPGLVLERAVRITVENAPVIVVALTASENARPRPLTSAWAEDRDPLLAVILATLHATARTVTRWLYEGGDAESAPANRIARAASAAERRFALLDFEVDRTSSGELDVGVRLAGFGESVGRRRNGPGDEAAHVQLGASATLDAVHELLERGGWSEHHPEGDLRLTGACRVTTPEHDIVVVLAEVVVDGRRIRLAGATSADSGVERASITATLQATNPVVADRGSLGGPSAALG